jgi:hypothetical protein
MINRIFFIADSIPLPDVTLPKEENVFISILMDPSNRQNLEQTYNYIASTSSLSISLVLNIREQISNEGLCFITSFLFLPSYSRIAHRQVINFTGHSQKVLKKVVADLSTYLSLQGFDDVVMNMIGEENNSVLFHSSDKLAHYYKEILEIGYQFNSNVFFNLSPSESMSTVLALLQQIEDGFKGKSPQLYSLINANKLLEQEIEYLKRKNIYTEAELSHQKQYADILRSQHSTRELQDYYNNEYEVLPKWYKRFGHLVKVVTGRRTFRSLFRDDVKKYKS